MVELPQAPSKTEVNFGTFAVAGKDNFAQSLSPDQRLKVLAWLQACPEPKAIAAQYGPEWTMNRYLHCNYWTAYIIDQAKKINLPLAEQFLTPILRPADEKPEGYDPESVPNSYLTIVSPGTAPWGYAATRGLIEETGRNWKIGEPRVSHGIRLLKRSIKEATTPAEFIAILANKVTKSKADPIAVLGHIFAIELEKDGVLFLVQDVVKAVKNKAPELWQQYLQLKSKERLAAGIIPSLS